MNDWVPLTAASIAAVVAVLGYLANGSINRLSERRKAYAQALADLEKLKQLPYDIRRRPESSAESRLRIAAAISEALSTVAFHRRWLMLDSKPVGDAYNALVAKVRDVNIAFRLDALRETPATEDHFLHLESIYVYDDRVERDACIREMRRELGLFSLHRALSVAGQYVQPRLLRLAQNCGRPRETRPMPCWPATECRRLPARVTWCRR